MKTTTRPLAIKDLTTEKIEAFSKEWGEPDWLLSLRCKAFKQYSELPWPTSKDARWKRSQLEKLEWDSLQFTSALLPGLESKSENKTEARARFDLSNGVSLDVPENLKENGLEWVSIEWAIKTQPERIEKAWSQGIDFAKNNKFLSLTLALANTGSYLRVPKGQVIKTPFQSLLISPRNTNAQFLVNFIFVDEAGEAQLWEELESQAESEEPKKNRSKNFISSYTLIHLKENAKANGYFIQNWGSNTSHFQFQNVIQSAFSRYNAIAISLGGNVFHNETTVHLQGQGAENKILGVLFGDKDQNFVNWITQNHTAPRTTSDIQYRGALNGSAHSFFSGLVSITKEAQQSDAYQSAKCLLLSKEARADAIPNLEILADDVKCSHGAAVGPVDEDQKYYLETRGIPGPQAEEIIIQGFLEPVISEVPSQTVQDQLRNFVEEKINNR